jgi:DNA polymerase-3 subunit delta
VALVAARRGAVTALELRRQIASGDLAPLYLVTGPDDLEMSRLAAELSESVPEDFRAFNVHRFHGTDKVTLAQVLDTASAYPLLAPRRVVLLLQAGKVLAKRGPGGDDRDDRDEGDDGPAAPATAKGTGPSALQTLKEYAAAPHDHATVAVFAGGFEKAFEDIGGRSVVVLCEPDRDPVGDLAAGHGVRFHPAAAQLLRQRAGEDLERLKADAERVLLYAAGSPVISREQVEAVVGRQAAAGGRALWGAVAGGRTAEALRELNLELGESAVPFMVLGLIRSAVERSVTGPALPEAYDALLRTDLALKTSGGDPQVLLERLVVEVCALARG